MKQAFCTLCGRFVTMPAHIVDLPAGEQRQAAMAAYLREHLRTQHPTGAVKWA
jgi:hypothetical protein